MKFTHQPGATPVDGFTIRRGIHRGGFGEVYYAVSDAGKEVALKLIQHEQDVELRGVTQCLNLKHPNLVNLFDVRTDSHGESWVVMEYVNGSSLEDVLTAFPNGLPLDEVRDWLTGLVAGVSHLHERGIVHRDLKPANVYRENGTVKVGDVGLSKKLGSDRRGAHTQSVGTVYYMAPEVARGQYGPEVDVYSLGIMLYELLTGRVPFTGETTAEILMKHLTAQPDLAPLPEQFRAVVARALEKDPHQRTPNAMQLEEEFVHALNGTLPSALPPSPRRGGPGRGDDVPATLNGHPTAFASGTLFHVASVPAAPVPVVPVRADGAGAVPSHGAVNMPTAGRNPVATHRDTPAFLRVAQIAFGAAIVLVVTELFGRLGGEPSRGVIQSVAGITWLVAIASAVYYATAVWPASHLNKAESVSTLSPAPMTPPPLPVSTTPVRRTVSSTTVSDLQRWAVLFIALVCGLMIFSPGTPRAWLGLGLIGLAYSAALFARSPRWAPSEPESLTEPVTPLKQALVQPVSSTRSRSQAMNHIPLGSLLSREALHEQAFSLTLASLCACLLSVGVMYSEEFLNRTSGLPSSEMMALFTATTMAGAWALILANQCTRRTSWGDRHPRLVNLIAGILVGTLAFSLDEFLKVEYLRSGMPRSAFQSLGVHALTTGGSNPTWLGYVVFFGLLFCVRRWWVEMDVQRSQRLSLGRLFSAGIAAFLVTVFFEFHFRPAMLWAVTLSATVQLATPWSPPRRRESFWRN